jgi:60 kDa SS-A/Ro ribonucleoprotein
MMSDPLKVVGTRVTPATEQVPTRTDQVVNDTGGFVFETDPWHQLERFLILGTWGNTLYVTEQKLTKDNVKNLLDLIREDSKRVVDVAVQISESGRAPRNQPALFAIAAVASNAENSADRSYAMEQMPKVARTSTHLFIFLSYAQQMRGWGRTLRTGVQSWYRGKNASQVAYQMVKYRQREGWTHRDALLKAHVKPVDESMGTAFNFAAGRVTEATNDEQLKVIDAFLEAQQLTEKDTKRAIELITDARLPWEALPDALLQSPDVWEALLPNMGQTALIRQLPRLTRVGLIKPLSKTSENIANMLTSKKRLEQGRVHPIGVLNALMTYRRGASEKSGRNWDPVDQIVDALNTAFYMSFEQVTPAGVRTLNALDVSGSMGWGRVAGSQALTPREASAAMALVTLITEPMTHTVAFSSDRYMGRGTGIETFAISKQQRVDDVVRATANLSFGATDCALPMTWALENKIEVDAFHVYTDSETNTGQIHPFQALRQYREKMGIDAKLIVYGMVGVPFTIADPRDRGMMDVVGLDASAPRIAADFAGGRL